MCTVRTQVSVKCSVQEKSKNLDSSMVHNMRMYVKLHIPIGGQIRMYTYSNCCCINAHCAILFAHIFFAFFLKGIPIFFNNCTALSTILVSAGFELKNNSIARSLHNTSGLHYLNELQLIVCAPGVHLMPIDFVHTPYRRDPTSTITITYSVQVLSELAVTDIAHSLVPQKLHIEAKYQCKPPTSLTSSSLDSLATLPHY